MLTLSQIHWASMHDWFIVDNGDGTITVDDSVHVEGKGWTLQLLVWRGTFNALRDWAGY